MSRGMTEDEAAATIVRGFVEPIARELPMEYAQPQMSSQRPITSHPPSSASNRDG
jgi:Fe-S cluster assembly scaffold protein SufB